MTYSQSFKFNASVFPKRWQGGYLIEKDANAFVGVSTRCRIEKKEENREGTQTRKHPNGYPQLEVFEKAATKKDDHNHPNSLQRINYRKENVNIVSKWK